MEVSVQQNPVGSVGGCVSTSRGFTCWLSLARLRGEVADAEEVRGDALWYAEVVSRSFGVGSQTLCS